MWSLIIATAVIGAAAGQIHHHGNAYHHFLSDEAPAATSSVQFVNSFAQQSSRINHQSRAPRLISSPFHQYDGSLRGFPQ